MKKWLCLSLIFFTLVACTSTNETEQEIAKVKIDTQFALFHEALFTADSNDLPKLKSEFPYMFPNQMPDELVVERMKDTNQQFLYKEVKKVYGDFKPQKKKIDELFKHIKYYFNDFKVPTVVTDITGVSYQDRVLYADTLLLVSLDMFLGKDNKVYGGYAKYLSETFTSKHMTSVIAQKIIETKYPVERDRTFLGQMIFEGKKAYLLDLFLPKVNDEIKLGYTPKKLAWAELNEAMVWAFFIKNEMLYSNDVKLKQRFLEVAPFSKFYTSIDRDSPGAIGKYLGLQIVKSYMDKYQISPQELIDLDAQTILNQSGYKPKK
ncbi:gliding motility lipoprotein GldB [Wenyingzhuangia sp. IMCC45467]